MDGSNILITGGAGFIGSNLTNKIISSYDVKKIIIVDNLISSESFNIPSSKKIKFLYGSISNDSILNKIPNIDIVFHLSCYHGNQSSIANPIEDHDNNLITSLKLFDFVAKKRNIKKIVYAAAGCAVAEKKYGKVNPTYEDSRISLFQDSPYSISKLVGEMYANYFYKQHGLPIIKARFQNVYGPREYLGAGKWRGTVNTIWRNVVPTFIWKAINNVNLELDHSGNTSRDFIFVDDIVEGLIKCAENGINGQSYNLATGIETKIKSLAKKIIKFTNSKSSILLKNRRTWDNSGNRFGSVIKSKTEIGFSSKYSLDSGLNETISWTINNRDRISYLIDKHQTFYLDDGF